MQRGALESAVALLVHLAGLGFYVYVHVYDGTNAKRTGGKGLPGIGVFGGRWKFLTYINLIYKHVHKIKYIQSNLSHPDTNETEGKVHISKGVLTSGFKLYAKV